MRLTSVLSGLALLGGSVLVAAPAHASPTPVPGCGAVLTTDSRLTADLTCPAGTGGLTLAEGVTLDLGRHTLRGPGDGLAVKVPLLGDVTIRNGTIAGWGTGIQNDPVEDEVGGTVTVSRVTFTGNGTGIDPSGRLGSTGKDFEVTRSTFTGNGSGVFAVYGGAHVVRSTFSGNDTAVRLITAGVTLEDSRVEHNGTGLSCDESGCVVRRSTLSDNGVGIDARWFGPEVEDSVLRRNSVAVTQFSVWGAGTISGSRFLDNGRAVELQSSVATLTDNVFRGNTLGFTTDGADPSFGPTTLAGNLFERNGDAISFDAPGVGLERNTANRNTGWGIYAPQATDLGGNRAKGNGREPQCVGVVCATSGPRS